MDVMDLIYNEMFEAMVTGNSIPYAPYIMMLIKHTLNTWNFPEEDCNEHLMKYPYVKKRVPAPVQPSEPSDTFMADARGRGVHGRTAHAPSVARKLSS